MIISLLLTIPLNKFLQIPHSSQWSSEVSVFMRKLYRFYSPPIPLLSSPISPLIVMVMGSIVRDQSGQLNWWKRDHREGRGEGVCIYQTWRIFIHQRLKEYIKALDDTWGRLSVVFQLSSNVLLHCLAWLNTCKYSITWPLLPQSRTCTRAALHQSMTCHCGHPLIINMSLLLHLPVWGMCFRTVSHITKGDLTVVSASSLWLVALHMLLCELFINL